MSPTRNPYRRTLVGVVVGVVDVGVGEGGASGTGAVEARIAIYLDRHAAEPLATIPVRWPAGTFRPSVGARLAVNIDPVE